MRLLFREMKQKELILKEKEKLKATWNEFAEHLKIKPGRLHAYYHDETLLPEEIFDKLSLKKEYEEYILDKKRDSWGKIKGGASSQGRRKTKVKFPEESVQLAEFIGIMLGDGNLNVTKKYKVGTYQARIVGDSRNDREYLINFVKPLIKSLFDIEAAQWKAKDANALVITATAQELTSFLQLMGLKPGNKIRSQVTIPQWIKENDSYTKACIRGLIDTDGSVFHMSNQNPLLARLSFTNYNKTLLEDTREIFLKQGFSPSKIICNKHFFISKKEEIKKYLKEIGFSNPKHIRRLHAINSLVV